MISNSRHSAFGKLSEALEVNAISVLGNSQSAHFDFDMLCEYLHNNENAVAITQSLDKNGRCNDGRERHEHCVTMGKCF